MRRFLAENARRFAGTGTPLFGAAVAVFAVALVAGGDRRLSATVGSGPDPDGDLLISAQEQVLGTSPTLADSDHDGFSDLEELARGSSPLDALHVPTGTVSTSVGMSAHGGADGNIHVITAVYSTLANPRQLRVNFGVQVDRGLVMLSNDWVAAHSTLQVTTGADGQSLVHLVDLAFDPAMILAIGHMTVFSTVGVAGSVMVQSADTVQLLGVDGMVVLIGPPPRPIAQMQGGGTGPTLAGGIYTPLPHGGAGGDIPSSWSQGEVCFQRSSPVAVNGPLVTQEIVSANCVNGFEGFCPPSCSGSVGSTYATVDPVTLIGG